MSNQLTETDVQRGHRLACEAVVEMADKIKTVYTSFGRISAHAEEKFIPQIQYNLLPLMESLAEYLRINDSLDESTEDKVKVAYLLLRHLELKEGE